MNPVTNPRLQSTANAQIFRAPGRVNIIGEHTDYNDGYVLPTNTTLYTRVSVLVRRDNRVRVHASNLQASFAFDLDALPGECPSGWAAYVFGVAAMLDREGVPLRGADLTIDGNIPIGGGLSSSAALELAVAHALLGAAATQIPAERLAVICQAAEREFAGVNCGIMDQFSVARGEAGKAMLLDCRSLDARFVPIPASIGFLVVDSGVKHALPDSGYNDRAGECAAAVRILTEGGERIDALRDATLDMLDTAHDVLGDVLYRRARHVVSENHRTTGAFESLENGDIDRLGKLINASHASLRDDYEVSCTDVELLVDIANRTAGVAGSRMVGAGFGGCVLAVIDPDRGAEISKAIQDAYGQATGSRPWTHLVSPAEPAGSVSGQ